MPVIKFDPLPDASESTQYPPSARITYLCYGEDEEAIVEAYAFSNIALAIPTPWGIIYRQPIRVRRIGFKVYHVDAEWSRQKWGPFQFSIRGRTGGGTQHISSSLSTVATSENAPDFQGQIGVTQENGDFRVEGTDIPISQTDLAVDVTYPAGFVNHDRIAMWTRNTPRVNNGNWQKWSTGEVLYLGTEFEDGSDIEARVTHNISISLNLTNFQVGGLTITEKQGWDLLWLLTEKDEDDGAPVTRAVHWYVERIFYRTSLTALFGF